MCLSFTVLSLFFCHDNSAMIIDLFPTNISNVCYFKNKISEFCIIH